VLRKRASSRTGDVGPDVCERRRDRMQGAGDEGESTGGLDEIRPCCQQDGGDIELVEIRDGGQVVVKLQGLALLPRSDDDPEDGRRAHLKERVPEVSEVVTVDP